MMKSKLFSLCLACLLLLCRADATASSRDEASRSGEAFLLQDEEKGFYQKGAPALALFLLAGLAGYGLFVWNRKKGSRQDSNIAVLAVKPLGQREKIAIVEILGERMVLGVTPHGISLLLKAPNGFSKHLRVEDETG